MVGYIGANGAGKSTTIKMLSGILVPSSGEVRVNGLLPYKDRQRNAKNIGAVFGQRTQLFWDIPVRQLSLGQKMRCELGAAFLHRPKVVYLDEPTIGLDVIVLLVLILSSGMIFVAINLFFATFSFWMVDSSPLIVAVFQLSMFSRYPLTIYNKGIRFLLTWIIPYGFTAFYPAAYFVQHHTYVMFAIWTPIVAVLACILAYLFWQRGVQAYSGTGS